MTPRTTTLLATLGAAMITTTSGAGDGPTADLFWIQYPVTLVHMPPERGQ